MMVWVLQWYVHDTYTNSFCGPNRTLNFWSAGSFLTRWLEQAESYSFISGIITHIWSKLPLSHNPKRSATPEKFQQWKPSTEWKEGQTDCIPVKILHMADSSLAKFLQLDTHSAFCILIYMYFCDKILVMTDMIWCDFFFFFLLA